MLKALELMNARPSRGPMRPGLHAGVGEALRGVDEVVAAPYAALAQQGQCHVGQVGEIAGAQRSELAGERRQPGIEGADQGVEKLGGDARAAGADLVGPGGHGGTDHGHGEDETGATGVAAQQVEPVALAILLGHPVGAERADPGGDAVEVVTAGQQRRDRLARTIVARPRFGGEHRHGAVAGDRRHPLRGEVGAVEDNGRALAVGECRRRHGAAL